MAWIRAERVLVIPGATDIRGGGQGLPISLGTKANFNPAVPQLKGPS